MDKKGAFLAAAILISSDAWFEATPMPDDNVRLAVKPENSMTLVDCAAKHPFNESEPWTHNPLSTGV